MVRGAEHSKQWSDLRRRTRIFWIVFLAYLPGIALFTALLAWLFSDQSDAIFLAAALGWTLALFTAAWYRTAFSCPNCGAHFFETSMWINMFSRKCLHCGLPRGGDPSRHMS